MSVSDYILFAILFGDVIGVVYSVFTEQLGLFAFTFFSASFLAMVIVAGWVS